MNFRPLGDRVLIQPELPSQVTESGLHLAEHRKPEQTGTVIAVGPCVHPRKVEAEDVASALETYCEATACDGNCPACVAAFLLCDLVRPEPSVKVGDYVVFSWQAGQELWVEDGEQRYLVMREADILCVVEGLHE